MLRPEEAAEQLTAFTADPDRPARAGWGRRLLAGPLVGQLEQWVTDPRTLDGRALGAQLDELDDRQLARTLTAVAPALGEAVARWWRWAQAGPYQAGWARRGYRSSRPTDSRAVRTDGLLQLLRAGRRWPQDPVWFAAWSSHLPDAQGSLAGLLASEVVAGRADVADVLTACAFGQHPISGTTRAGIAALLAADRPDLWEQVVTLLRNAGRQEGLRSAVLEAVDLAHPSAFARVLDVVVADDLTRFAGTVRAVGVWVGEEITVRRPGGLATVVAELARAVADPGRAGVPADDPVTTFVRLHALALHDAHLAIPAAADLLGAPDPGTRRAAARLLAELGLDDARDALRPALADPDLAVYATAVSAWPASPFARDLDARLGEDSVTVLMDRVRTLGKATTVETGLIGSRPRQVGSAHAADVVLAHRSGAAAPPEAMAAASADGRAAAARVLAADPLAHRAALVAFLTDSSSGVRRTAQDAVDALPVLSADEVAHLQDALRRTAGDVRQHAITTLLRQPPGTVRAAVDALAAGTPEQARAAGELARRAGVPVPAGSPAARTAPAVPGLPDALRVRAVDRTPAVRPPAAPPGHFDRFHPACTRVVTSLRAWLAEHADVEVTDSSGRTTLLADLRWLPRATAGAPLPLPEVLGPWWERTAPTLTDGGVELLLLSLAVPRTHARWAGRTAATVIGPVPADPTASALVWPVIDWLARSEHRPTWTDLAIDAATSLRAQLPLPELTGPVPTMSRLGRRAEVDRHGRPTSTDARAAFLDPATVLPLADLTAAQLGRLWWLARFVDEPEGTFDLETGPWVEVPREDTWGRTGTQHVRVPDQPARRRPSTELLCRALDVGAATRADLLEALLRGADDHGSRTTRPARAVERLTARRPPDWARSPVVQAVVDEVRAAAVAGEVVRGDLPGPLTEVARRIRSATGIPGAVGVLAALGKRPFTRGYSWTASRESSLSALVRIHLPGPDDTAEDLTAALTAAGIGPGRAVEFGVYAPQWAGLVEQHLGWPGFESAVWWVHAHTRDESWSVDPEIRAEWASAVSQRTPLDSVDLVRGAADVAWFRAVQADLGTERFDRVLAAAKYASGAGGHKRAELFARALLGRVEEAELVTRIEGKRHQDSVRAMGLLPLDGPQDPALLARWERLAGFVASDRTSGSQRRTSETTAVAIGMENLARTAGYRDPGRLTWAMEAAAVRDLAAGPVTAVDGDLRVTLAIGDDGAPQLDVRRGARALKAVPAAAAKTPAIAELRTRVSALRAQVSRMRRSLESSCVTGERFEPTDVAEMLAHPVLAPMLRTLVLVTEEGVTGFPDDDPSALRGPAGQRRATDGSALRIAHPVDLLAGGEWPELQHDLFTAEVRQPFRQLFRELYLPTSAETADGPTSRRWAGQQVEARRAAALFTGRGWVADHEAGFGRTFHAEKITAWCSVLEGFGTAAEVEDATVDEVTFVRAGSWRPVPLVDVPPRLFSETMRDLDLVVSVAHAGGVDPETSESTTAARRRLVEETVQLLGLANVETTDHHARIRGTLGTYSVQLGSGVVHRQPGNALCIIPVGAQHRGRVFLPFADDDPRTAEVISKVLLLARDDRIQDPSILEQLR